jgi:hypothetical protein
MSTSTPRSGVRSRSTSTSMPLRLMSTSTSRSRRPRRSTSTSAPFSSTRMSISRLSRGRSSRGELLVSTHPTSAAERYERKKRQSHSSTFPVMVVVYRRRHGVADGWRRLKALCVPRPRRFDKPTQHIRFRFSIARHQLQFRHAATRPTWHFCARRFNQVFVAWRQNAK